MFPDALLPNVLLFAAGQAAAWAWLRTGFVGRGVAVMVAIWLLADWALVARFVFADAGGSFVLALSLLQLLCAVEAAWLLLLVLRRRFGRLRRQRRQLFAAAFAHHLRGEPAPARALLQRLLRHDPWDVPSRILLALVLSRLGRRQQARRLLRRARGLDRGGSYRDLVVDRLALLQAAPPPARAS